jgi:hypothetical protein
MMYRYFFFCREARQAGSELRETASILAYQESRFNTISPFHYRQIIEL